MLRVSLIAFALLSAFFFPWPVTLIVTLVASYFMPPVALGIGVLCDLLYFVPGPGQYPMATILGVVGLVFMFLVQGFVKTRIMGR
ncbi:MAG: hypothetical protein JWN64_691 [Parcubacteria group bacterium]|nr:hypothetical protein [Parcubacteria group bacterium]